MIKIRKKELNFFFVVHQYGTHGMLLGTGRIIHKDYKAYTIFFIRLFEGDVPLTRVSAQLPTFLVASIVILPPRYLT